MVGKINRPKVITQKLSKNDETLINKINSLGDNLALNLIEDFFKNHGLFKIRKRPQWFTVSNRSKSYVNKILSVFPPENSSNTN